LLRVRQKLSQNWPVHFFDKSAKVGRPDITVTIPSFNDHFMSIVDGKRSLICYFSRTGLTKRVVDLVHAKITSELFEIKADANYAGMWGYLRGCLHALWGGPSSQHPLPDFSGYDTVVVAGPVWGWRLSTPLVAFLEAADFGGKNVVSLPTAGGQVGKFNEDMAAKVRNGNFVPKDGFVAVHKDSDEELDQKVTAWLQGL
jgi:flavodoxin